MHAFTSAAPRSRAAASVEPAPATPSPGRDVAAAPTSDPTELVYFMFMIPAAMLFTLGTFALWLTFG